MIINHGRPPVAKLDLARQIEGGTVSQIDVEQHSRGSLCGEGRQRRRAGLGFNRLVAPTAQRLG